MYCNCNATVPRVSEVPGLCHFVTPPPIIVFCLNHYFNHQGDDRWHYFTYIHSNDADDADAVIHLTFGMTRTAYKLENNL